MDVKHLANPLPIDSIEFRVQSVNNGGYAIILAYKNARIDQQRLDEVVGPLNWKREHSRDNHNCTVSIWDVKKGLWVGKEDTGSESNTEAQKGLASDSFKRACFNWGIGRELYSFPLIQVKLNDGEWEMGNNGRPRTTYKLNLKNWHWSVKRHGGQIYILIAKDETGAQRFYWQAGPEAYADYIDARYAVEVDEMKRYLNTDDLSGAAQIWFELDQFEQSELFVAQSNGGPFDAQERSKIKSSEFRTAYYGEIQE